MKHFETSSNQPLIIERPIFSSTLLALFMVLRKNYYERNTMDSNNGIKLGPTAKGQSDIQLN